MIDPTPPDLEELFGQEREIGPVEEPVRLRIQSRLAGTLGTATVGPVLKPPAAWRGWLWKVGLATLGGVLVTLVVASRRGGDAAQETVPSPTPVASAVEQDAPGRALATASASPAAGTALEIRDLPDAPHAPEESPRSTAASSVAAGPSTDEALRRERDLTDAAQASLSRGDWASALRTLDKASAEFPKGRLQQEREALAIRSLWLSGARGRARERASSFRERFPNSPLLHALDETLVEPTAAP